MSHKIKCKNKIDDFLFSCHGDRENLEKFEATIMIIIQLAENEYSSYFKVDSERFYSNFL